MNREGRELASNLAFSLVLHFLVFAGVFLTPSLYAERFHVPVAYKVTLVELPGSPQGATSSGPGGPVVKAQPPKVQPEAPPPPPTPAPKAKVVEAKPAPPASPDTLALPKKQKMAARPPKATEPAAAPAAPTASAVAQAPAPAALPGGRGAGGSPGVVSESSVSTESADPALSYYLAAIQTKVSSRWVEPTSGLRPGQSERVTLGFTVLRSGLVRDVLVLSPSGNVFLDQSALRAVQEAVPLPPFPPLFAEEKLLVRFHFEMRGQ